MYKEVNGRWGPIRYFGKDEYVGRSIHNYGEYNPDETEMILSLAEIGGREKMCLDIGANIGCISQALGHEGFNVVAFEPQLELFALLQYNAPSAMHINWAVGSESGIAKMPKVYYSDKGNFGGLGLHEKSIYGTIDVGVLVLDDSIVSKMPIGFIKIDVEGYELEVLKGATGLIRRDRPILYIEDDRTEKSNALRAYINELGYTITEHRPTLYREQNFFKLEKNIWDRNYASHNLICRPV